MAQLEFYYDFGSPNVYFMDHVLHKIAQEHDAEVVYKPMLLGGVFKATNNQPPMMAFARVTHKLDYMRLEIDRFIRRYGMEFTFNPHFPVMTIMAMRGSVFAQGKAWERNYISTLMKAMWVDGEKMDDPSVMQRVLDQAGLPTKDIMAANQDPEVKASLATLTAAAVARKVFGAPTVFVGDEMFFGKDSLDDLRWYLMNGVD